MQFLIPSLSFLLCLAATPAVRFLALKRGWIAQPKEDRWHKKPTALLGGIAIYFGFSTALFFLADFSSISPHFFRTSESLNLPRGSFLRLLALKEEDELPHRLFQQAEVALCLI